MDTDKYKDILISFERMSWEPYDGRRIMVLTNEDGSDFDVLNNYEMDVSTICTSENVDLELLELTLYTTSFKMTGGDGCYEKPILYFPEPLNISGSIYEFDRIKFEDQMKFISNKVFKCNMTIVHDWFGDGSVHMKKVTIVGTPIHMIKESTYENRT